MHTLRSKLIRLAYANPGKLRDSLLPILASSLRKHYVVYGTHRRANTPPVTFRKTQQGEWVIMMPESYARVGDTVAVTKKDGHTKNVQIVRIRRPFNVQGKPYVYCEFKDSSARPVSAPSMSVAICDNCGARISGSGEERVDSSGIRGIVCRNCARASRYELSFA